MFNEFESATYNLQLSLLLRLLEEMLTCRSEAQLANLVICVLESHRKLLVAFPFC